MPNIDPRDDQLPRNTYPLPYLPDDPPQPGDWEGIERYYRNWDHMQHREPWEPRPQPRPTSPFNAHPNAKKG